MGCSFQVKIERTVECEEVIVVDDGETQPGPLVLGKFGPFWNVRDCGVESGLDPW
jgi:hypothetical protein